MKVCYQKLLVTSACIHVSIPVFRFINNFEFLFIDIDLRKLVDKCAFINSKQNFKLKNNKDEIILLLNGISIIR